MKIMFLHLNKILLNIYIYIYASQRIIIQNVKRNKKENPLKKEGQKAM